MWSNSENLANLCVFLLFLKVINYTKEDNFRFAISDLISKKKLKVIEFSCLSKNLMYIILAKPQIYKQLMILKEQNLLL